MQSRNEGASRAQPVGARRTAPAVGRLAAVVFGLVLVLAGGSPARANLIDIKFVDPAVDQGLDLSTYAGAAEIGAAGNVWNAVNIDSTNTALPLDLATGGDSGAALTMAASSDGCCTTSFWATSPYYSLMLGMTANNGMTASFSGLAPGLYDLWVYTPYGLGDMTANGVSVSSLSYDTSDTLLSTHAQLLTPTVGEDGSLSFSSDQRVSGFQLDLASSVAADSQPVPEPAGMWALAIGCAGLISIRWGRPPDGCV